MSDKIKITAIGGSLEQNSSTSVFMNFSAAELRLKGAEVSVIDLRDFVLPLYSNYIEIGTKVGKALDLLNLVRASDGLIFASPEYHGTVSAAFKNVIDYLEHLSIDDPPYITGKPVALIAAAGAENSGAATISTMINIVHSLRGIVIPGSIGIGSAGKQIDKSGQIISDSLKRKLKRLAEELYYLTVKLK
jgi:FMN reductase